ncbi:hypothetical protein BU17DRAFT_87460 [Hysterangium stoloniferum]|nr:hypothetical protein BU17DRAFT_87460 [Hysterangium stoloniferum]
MVVINFLVVGGDKPFDHIFPVQTSPDETIRELRKSIWEERARWGDSIGADTLTSSRPKLTLYRPKQTISTDSEDIFNGIFAQLKLDTPEGRASALEKLNATFTVKESGLSEPARHQLHVLVVVPANSISPRNTSNSGLSDIQLGQPPAKRLRVEESVMSGGHVKRVHSNIPPKLLDYYLRFWGNPLDPALTILPDQANTTNLESEEQESNGDVLPGEPFLKDVSQPMLVRAEYIRVLDAVKAAYQKSHNTSFAVITGQPGIGKTSWINYALRYCLGKKQPVVRYLFGNCYFFSGSGVVIIDPLLYQSGGKHTWCFVDVIDGEMLPPKICSSDIQLFPVYVTYPKESHWHTLHQSQRIPSLIVMNPWTLDELEKARNYTPIESLKTFVNVLGNNGWRMSQQQNRLSSFLQVLYSRTNFLTKFALFVALITLACTSTLSALLDFVRRQLLIKLWTFEQNGVLKMLRRHIYGSSRGIPSLFFEAYFQKTFAEGIDIDAKPMSRGHLKNSRWHSTVDNSSSFQEGPRNASLDTSSDFSLHVTPAGTIEYNQTEQLTIKEAWYYIPCAANEAAIDSLLLHDGHLYLFQFTTGSTDDINPGLQNVLNRFTGLPPQKDWRFIFIVPDDLEAFSYPHSNKGFLLDHIPFTAQVGVHGNPIFFKTITVPNLIRSLVNVACSVDTCIFYYFLFL